MSKPEEKKEVSRRDYLKTTGAAIAGLVVGGAIGYVAKPAEVTTTTATVTAPASTVTQTVTGTVTATASPTATGMAGLSKQYAGTKLNVILQPQDFLPIVEKWLPEFKDATGIDVSFSYYPENERRAKVLTDASTGTGSFQLYYCDEAINPALANAGYIVPLKDYFPAEFDSSDFIDAFRDQILSWKGVWYTAPFYGGLGDYLFYRKDLFSADNISVPTNMDELMAAAKHFQKPPNTYGITLRGQRGFGMNVWLWQEYSANFAGKPVYFDSSMNPIFNRSDVVDATNFYTKLIRDYGAAGGQAFTWSEMLDAFDSGKVAMLTGDHVFANWCEDPSKSKVVGNVGYTTFPKGKAPLAANTYSHGLAISASGCKTEDMRHAAGQFIGWITSKDIQLRCVKWQAQPIYWFWSRKSVLNSPELAATPAPKDLLAAIKAEAGALGPIFPQIPQWPDIGDYLGVRLEELFTGQRTDAKAALDDAVAHAKQALAKS
jgi:multiple sugar transport system substrate-binding protein